jgi:hypothetical protein
LRKRILGMEGRGCRDFRGEWSCFEKGWTCKRDFYSTYTSYSDFAG